MLSSISGLPLSNVLACQTVSHTFACGANQPAAPAPASASSTRKLAVRCADCNESSVSPHSVFFSASSVRQWPQEQPNPNQWQQLQVPALRRTSAVATAHNPLVMSPRHHHRHRSALSRRRTRTYQNRARLMSAARTWRVAVPCQRSEQFQVESLTLAVTYTFPPMPKLQVSCVHSCCVGLLKSLPSSSE